MYEQELDHRANEQEGWRLTSKPVHLFAENHKQHGAPAAANTDGRHIMFDKLKYRGEGKNTCLNVCQVMQTESTPCAKSKL